MASVLLRADEQPVVAYDPQQLLLVITREYEGLRSCLRERCDVPADEIAEQALRCARALTCLAERARRAERQAVCGSQEVLATPVANPVVKVERIATLASQPAVQPVPTNCALYRRCRGLTNLFFPGL